MQKRTVPKSNTGAKVKRARAGGAVYQENLAPDSNLTWSFSRHDKFTSCKFLYLLHYYIAAQGWLATANPVKRLAYNLKQLTNPPLWKGDLAHRAIEHWLTAYVAGEPEIIDDVLKDISDVARAEYAQMTDPAPKGKAVRMFELEYPNLAWKPFDKKAYQKLVGEVKDLFCSWTRHPIFETIQGLPIQNILRVEKLETVNVCGNLVFVKVDFAYLNKDGNVVVPDWKTGKRSSGHRMQLNVYALALSTLFQKRMDQIKLCDVYLMEQAAGLELFSVKGTEAEETIGFVGESIGRMKQVLTTPDCTQPKDDWSLFPRVCDERPEALDKVCKRCSMFKICHGEDALYPAMVKQPLTTFTAPVA